MPARAISAARENVNVSRCEQISVFVFSMMLSAEEVWRVNQLPLTREDPNGNPIDHSSRCGFAWRWGLGLLTLAQGLAFSWCQEERCNCESLTLKRARGEVVPPLVET
jgi:hypothetical protein